MFKLLVFILIFSFLFSCNAYCQEVAGLKVENLLGVDCISLLVKKDGNSTGNEGKIVKYFEYLLVGLSLPENKFWVNLNPLQPDKITDYELGSTDIGRIMLEADLQLKKDAAVLTNPKTSETGREYWDKLYSKAQELMPGYRIRIPNRTRLWIVPDKTVVFEEGNSAYITEAKMQVMSEARYLPGKGDVTDGVQKEFQDYATKLVQELILPYLNQRLNDDPVYQSLREVYASLILGKWYRQKFSLNRFRYLNVIQDANLDFKHTPQEIFKEYTSSLKSGEYSFNERIGSTRRRYFSGGIDFKGLKIEKTTQRPDWKNSKFFTCMFFLPQEASRPLQYVKGGLELNEGNLLEQDVDSTAILAKNLPAIASPDSYRTDKIVLSKL